MKRSKKFYIFASDFEKNKKLFDDWNNKLNNKLNDKMIIEQKISPVLEELEKTRKNQLTQLQHAMEITGKIDKNQMKELQFTEEKIGKLRLENSHSDLVLEIKRLELCVSTLKDEIENTHVIHIILADEERNQELSNGLESVGSYVLVKLLQIIDPDDDKIRKIISMGQTFYLLSKSRIFFISRFPKCPVTFFSTKPGGGGFTLAPSCLGLRCLFKGTEGPVFLTTLIETGVYQWTVEIVHGHSAFSYLNFGAVPCDLIDKVTLEESIGTNLRGACSFDIRKDLSDYYLDGSDYYLFCCGGSVRTDDPVPQPVLKTRVSVPDRSILMLEMDAREHTFSVFVNDRKVPKVLSNIHPALYLGVMMGKGASFTTVSFSRACAPRASSVVCYFLEVYGKM